MTYGVRGATVRFHDTVALDEVSLEVPAGSVAAVVGGDGAGKSTLLRALVGLVALDAGTTAAPAKERTGFLSARAGSWGSLTARQNLDFAGGAYGLRGAELARRRTDLLAQAGLDGAEHRLAARLSGGMRRKLGFAMASIHRPDLLVLDEPSTGVDPVSRVDLWRMISQAASAGTAVLMSTTYLDEAERAARLAVLDGGRILVQGSFEEVRSSFTGAIVETTTPRRPEWSWRRGRRRHEYWPEGTHPPRDARPLIPDLEDIVISLSLINRAEAVTS
ncbi:ABC transporter ATP-binding protein [Nocardioides insulae]|uniref:ABC transporter ATP-binding protein n=1 Tax=Nocardioides insulae TaxID=394734 RepID=UPI0003FA163A|nr:ABC transporter ATP-binding protein [Nocardioides insulae]